jgi:RNA polymerase sigma-70 factor (ECF subfamily)
MVQMDTSLPASLGVASAGRTSFDALFSEQRDRLFSALWLITHDRHEAEEIAQDAFVRVLERWDRDGAPDDPTAYLFRTAMNILRNRRRRAAVALRHAVSRSESRDGFEAVEARDVVTRALSALTPRQRAALVLIDLLDLPSEEAAEALGIRPSTVRVLAARGRAILTAEIGATDG